MKSFFTEIQWQWVSDRFREGYSIGDLALFLGIHRNTVRRGLIRLGTIPEVQRDLPPLRPRRAEFVRLNRLRGAARFEDGGDSPAASGDSRAVSGDSRAEYGQSGRRAACGQPDNAHRGGGSDSRGGGLHE